MPTPKPGQPCLARRAVEILQSQFGRLPPKAAAHQMGVPVETWKNWRDGASKPSTDHLSLLFLRFGHRFVARVMEPFTEAALDARQAELDAEIARLEAKRAALETHRALVRHQAATASLAFVREVAGDRGSAAEEVK